MAAPTIKTGLNTANPMTFAKTRHGYLVGVNGLDRGIFWDGRSAAADELGIDPPPFPPVVLTPQNTSKPATATVTVVGTAGNLNSEYVRIIDSYGRSIEYIWDNTNVPVNTGVFSATNQCKVYIKDLSNVTDIATQLKYAIWSKYGHDGTMLVSQSSGVLTLTQLEGGVSGNTTITEDSEDAELTKVDFSGGVGTNRGGYSTIIVADGDAAHGMTAGEKITLTSTDGSIVDYFVSDTADSGVAHLGAVIEGAALKSTGSITASLTSGATGISVGFDLSSGTQNAYLVLLKAAIEHLRGHNGKIIVSDVPSEVDEPQPIILHQATEGPAGNTAITTDIDQLSASDTTFGGGTNVEGATGGDYTVYYRYVDEREGTKFYSNLSPFFVINATAGDRFSWRGLQPASQGRVTHVQLLRTTFNQASTLYVVAYLPSGGAIQSATDASGVLVLTVLAGHGVVAGMRVDISSTSGSTYNAHNTIYEVSSVTSTSITMENGLGGGASSGGTWRVEGFTKDTLTDGQMVLFRGDYRQKILQSNGRPAANRHSIPPFFKSVAVNFQDRMTYLVDPEYSTGTISATGSNSYITGASTGWSSSLVGRILLPDPTVDSNTYIIDSVSSAGLIQANKNVSNIPSGTSYTITNPPLERNTVYISEQDLPESVITQVAIQENVRDEDELVGATVLGAAYYALKQHSIYRITWASQPLLDAQPQLAAMRGAINHRCADQHEGTLYIMDDEGPYTFSGNQVSPIGAQIADQWSDQTLDFSKKSTWSVQVDPLEELVYFFVTHNDDTGSRPKRALVYDIRTQTWSQWKYVWEIGSSVKLPYSNQRRMLIGADTDNWYVANEGTYDGIVGNGTVRGTVTTGYANGLSDSSATFPSDCEGASVAIVSGTGANQIRKISSRVSGTKIEVDSTWATTPDTTSVYLIGAIEWMWKSGMFAWVESNQQTHRYFRITFQPTANDATLSIRKYDDHSTSPVQMNEWNDGDGVSVEENATEAIANLKLTQHDDGNEPGSKCLPWTGKLPSLRGRPKRWVTCEVSGYQGQDRIILYELEIGGVK